MSLHTVFLFLIANFKMDIKGVWGRALHFFFPLKCHCCLRDLSFDCQGPLCPECLKSLQEIRRPYCRLCGSFLKDGGDLCRFCFEEKSVNFKFSRSAYVFEPVIRELIHDFKYRGFKKLGAWLGQRMAERISYYPEFRNYDCVSFVPLSAGRLRERGYNQSEMLAQEISLRRGLFLLKGAVIKKKNTVAQAKLDRAGRIENVKGSFSCVSPIAAKDLRIILVDDVATTLATLNAAACAFYEAGAKEVACYTLAREIFQN